MVRHHPNWPKMDLWRMKPFNIYNMYKPTRTPLTLSLGVYHRYFYFAQSEKLELNFFVLFLINNISRVLVVTWHCLSYHFVPQQKEKFRFSKGKCALESTCTIVLLLFQKFTFMIFIYMIKMIRWSKGKMYHKYCRTIKKIELRWCSLQTQDSTMFWANPLFSHSL